MLSKQHLEGKISFNFNGNRIEIFKFFGYISTKKFQRDSLFKMIFYLN